MPISFQQSNLLAPTIHRGKVRLSTVAIALLTGTLLVLPSPLLFAQSPAMKQKIEEIKQAMAVNKQELTHFTWQEQQIISLKGNVKKTVIYQVSIGPDGTQQKTQLSSLPAPAPPRGGRLRQHIVEKKTDEFEQYGQQIAALAKQYAQPDPQAMQQAYQQGNISLQLGGSEGTTSLVIKNYLKPGDTVTLVFNSAAKAIQSLQVSSYLGDPKDAVALAVQFAKLSGGPNHVASIQVNGVSKQMTVYSEFQLPTYADVISLPHSLFTGSWRHPASNCVLHHGEPFIEHLFGSQVALIDGRQGMSVNQVKESGRA